MQLDRLGAQVTLPWEHHKVHHGEMYSASVYNAALGAAGTLTLSINTPAGGEKTHLKLAVDANKSGVAILAEGDTISAGSTVSALNMNRNNTGAYGGTLKKDATRGTPGTTIRTLVIGTPGVFGSGGNVRTETEWNLLPGTTYSIVFTADGAATEASINAEFYED